MQYEEVRVQLTPKPQGKVQAAFLFEGKAAPVQHTFLPPSDIDAESLYRDWIDSFKEGAAQSKEELARRRDQIGRRLFETLFKSAAGDLRERLTALEQRQAGEELCGLRLRLMIGDAFGNGSLAASDLLRTSRLPWELSFDPDRGRRLGKSHLISLVRTIGTNNPPRSTRVRVDGQLRVLVANSRPEGSKLLNWPAEKAHIKKALEKYAFMEFLDHASFKETCHLLESGAFHILHFIGHGGFDKKIQQGYLLFEKQGQKDRVYARDLADRFGNVSTLKVALFNACRSGELPGEEDGDPLSGVAAAVSAAGVPVVVAMQVPVTDGMAIDFSEAFYGTIQNGLPVEAAVAQGRRDVRIDSPEWATPVLYLRGSSSELFDFRFRPGDPGAPAVRSGDEDEEPEELVLGVRSFVESKDVRLAEWAVRLNETTERFLPLEEFFEDRFIRDQEDWNDRLLPRLEDFLADAVHQHRPLVLCLAAHATVAFAAGYFFHTKEDAPLTLLQMTAGKPFRWSAGVGSVPEGPLWQDFVEVPLDPDARDIAVAVEISQSTSVAVEEYLKKSGLNVGRLVRARIVGEPGKARVESGAHAWQMASQLHQWLKDHTGDLGRRRLHLFIAAPNGFVFFLGQLARSLGPLRLYEYDFETGKHATYEPSLELKRLITD